MIIDDIQVIEQQMKTIGTTPAGKEWLALQCHGVEDRITKLHMRGQNWTATKPVLAKQVMDDACSLMSALTIVEKKVNS